MIGEKRRYAQSTPLTRPTSAPVPTPISTPTPAGAPQDAIAIAVTMPEKPILEPTDISTCPAITSSAMTAATTPIAA